MPAGMAGDFLLDGKPFLLQRGLPGGGRAWRRTGISDAPSRRNTADTQYGNLPDEVDHPEVWNDWSGGAGHAYRTPDNPNTYHWGENVETRFPGQLVHAQQLQLLPARYASTNLNVDDFLDVPLPGVARPPAGAGAVLAVGRGFVVSYAPTGLNTAGSAFDRIYEATGGGALAFRGRPATFGSFTYVGNNDGSGFYQRGHDGLTYTLSNVLPGKFFQNTGNRLWRFHGVNLAQNCAAGADPLISANWSATYNIGNGEAAVESAIDLGGNIFAGLAEGLFQGDFSGTFVNVTPDLRFQRHPDNCRDLAAYQNTIVAPHVGGVYEFYASSTQAEAREIGPGARVTARSPVRGRARAVRSLGPWVYAGLWTGSQSYLLAGRDASDGLPYVWHIQQRLPHVAKVRRIHVDGITTPSGGGAANGSINTTEIPNRLWVATDASTAVTGTAPLYYAPVPRGHDNPLADPTFTANYCGSARIDFGSTDWGSPGTPKVFRALEVWADALLTGAQYADVYYAIDNGSRTYLGRAQTSPKTTLFFPAGDGLFQTGQQIALSVESYTASFNVSPVYRSFVLRGALRPGAAKTITAAVRLADNLQDRTGNQMRPGALMLQELRDMADGATPRKLIDLTGAANWVAVLQPVEEVEVWQEGVDEPELAATVKMAVLTFTADLSASQALILRNSYLTRGLAAFV